MSHNNGRKILKHIEQISSFGHRWMGSRGERKTRAYIAAALKSAGLKVARQPFAYMAFKDYSAALSVAGRSLACEPLAYAAATPEPLTAPVLYVGKGTSQDFQRLAKAGRNIRDSIVLSDNLRSFVAYPEAEAAGARGFLLATTLPGNTIRCGSVRFDRQPGRIPAVSIGAEDSRRLIEALKAAPSQRATLSVNCTRQAQTGENIIGRTINAKLSSSRIILAAHFDSFWNGVHAMDNLAGVATLIELARTLPETVQSNLEFVFFGGEELGSWGAAGYVGQPGFDSQQIRAFVNLDTFGSRRSQVEIGVTADLVALCQTAADQLGIVPDCWHTPPRTASDHKEFIPFGIPSVWLANNGADPTYHTPLDGVEQISTFKLEQVFLLAARITRLLAGAAADSMT